MRRAIQNADELFAEMKEYMKISSSNRVHIKLFKESYHNQQDSSMGKIVEFLNTKSKYDKSMSSAECVLVLNKVLDDAPSYRNKFKIEGDYIVYISKYNGIKDDKTLLKEIESTPEGLFVDDELLKFSSSDNIKGDILKLIYKRQILPVKSKMIEKSKIK